MKMKRIKQERRSQKTKALIKKNASKSNRYRLVVSRSLKHIVAQIVDDTQKNGNKVIISASTKEKDTRNNIKLKGSPKIEKANAIGILLAKRAIKNNVTKIAFDRNGLKYHGRVKALAEGARSGGLDF